MSWRCASLVSLALTAACAAGTTRAPIPPPGPKAPAYLPQPDYDAASSAPTPSASAVLLPGPPQAATAYGANAPEARVFADWLAKHKDLSADDVLKAVGARRPDSAPAFDPTTASYYDKVKAALQLTPAEEAIFKRNGIVAIDHGQSYTMASMYHAIYARDLPVFVSSDSILHAMHRSFDAALMQLEATFFLGAIDSSLSTAHAALAREAPNAKAPDLANALRDADLYLTVARNLLAGLGDPNQPLTGVSVPSVMGQAAEATAILQAVQAMRLQSIALYGGEHEIDFSQFKVRGHYTKSPELGRYFRAMMWLGRPDAGFAMRPPPPASRLRFNVDRERTAAAALALLVRAGGQGARLQAVRSAIDYLVGEADDLSVADMDGVLRRTGINTLAALADPARRAQLATALEQPPRVAGQILGQAAWTSEPPSLMQLFGQSFAIDSFVLASVVYDRIGFQGRAVERYMPTGLDVAAALGNDEAVALLEPQLREYPYGSNLLAARAVVDSYPAERWNKSVYNVWLDSLRTLDDVPTSQTRFPQVMRGRAWQHKQLQTQLASWAELRHDTILYAKQSYSSFACEYPAGYVEPYPQFFARVGELARSEARLLRMAELQKLPANALPNPPAAQRPQGRRPPPPLQAPAAKPALPLEEMAKFFDRFADTMKQLQSLADKELAGKPFTEEEKAFLKKTVDMRGGGSGPPRFDGWYPNLIYGGRPDAWMPTVSDVHTDPNDGGKALEEAVGDTNFLVVAVDNDNDRMVFVGPSFTYYELTAPASARMTDEEWQSKIRSGQLPPRPSWTASFAAPARQRSMPLPYTGPQGRVPQGGRPPVPRPPR